METSAQENAVLSQNKPIIIEQPKQNNFLVILLSILLLLSVSIAGFFAYQTQMLVKELTSMKATSTPVSTEEPKDDPMTDWKTYANVKMFLSLKYPEDRNLQVISSQYNKLNFAINTEQYAPMFFEVAFLPNTQMDKWYEMAYSSAEQATQTRPSLKQGPTIGGKSSSYSDFVQSGNGLVRHVFVQVGSGLYQFVIPTSNNDLQYQILSTSKFTN